MRNYLLTGLLSLFLLLLVACKALPQEALEEEHLTTEEVLTTKEIAVIPPVIKDSTSLIVSKPILNQLQEKSILKDDEVFTFSFSTDLIYGMGGMMANGFSKSLYIVDGHGKLRGTLHNVNLIDGGTGIINTSNKYFLGVYKNDKMWYGLYDFKVMDWSTPPIYNDLSMLSSGYYRAAKDGLSGVIDEFGNVVVPFEIADTNVGFYKYSNFYVVTYWQEELHTVYDLDGNMVVDKSPIAISGFGPNLLYTDYAQNGQTYLTDVVGNVLMGPVGNNDLIMSYNGQEEESLVFNDGINFNIYDTALNLRLQVPSEHFMRVWGASDYYFAYMDDGTEKFYWLDGSEILSSSGHPYERSINSLDYTASFLQRNTENGVEIIDTKTKKAYTLSILGDTLYFFSVYENGRYSTIESNELGVQFKVYDASGEIFSVGAQWYYNSGDWLILEKESQVPNLYLNTVIDRTGTVIYESKYPESIQLFDNQFLYVQRGNYAGIMDFEGNWIYKIGPEEN
ncbi:MAG: hypothetical protein H7X94_01070 [Vallitaleaceae bacterium]|nr:hypothetical protein [Vallitaleaceae bacterium]